ncbi:uncharacterized protein LOC130084505 [Rhinichthys klamathensis goyatoka]|uniref:uncharacterized protein LOC130084505 n=1 Tax=Rhinichthys klamathensis goyatoka TaxID=3034132 RepID=UPI0024B48EF0|nr:uncharacterized protein LOC130084505 [Rhinichthys klamathensis goyatoka]
MKEDTSILVHIRDKDCVSLEVRYHKSCYRQYTRFLTKSSASVTGTSEEQNEPTFDASYKIFCERIIRHRIIVNQEVLTMTQLRRIFLNLVKKHEDLDASNYRQDKLKRRLARDFPQLVFHSPKKRNISEMVFVETLSADKLIDRLPHPSGTETTESTEVTSQSDCENRVSAKAGPQRPTSMASINTAEDTRTLYSAALILKMLLCDSPGMKCPWPPTSDDLNVSEAKSVVPIELYNLISWIIGATEEPTLAHYVDIPDDLNLKVISICQDIVYLASKGRRQTPKSLCLGLTVRHLTGSSHIVSLLNRLGHCASWDTVVSLDTSLAQLTLVEGRDKIPKGFSKKVPTVLVWDNIDFGEETLSGRGTTHHTNGIMLQSSVVEPVSTTNRQPLQKGVSSFKAPPSIPVEPYHQSKRQGPQNLFHHESVPLQADTYKLNTVSAVQAELAYVFVKSIDAEKCTIPSWTGFHTLLQGDGTLQKSALYYLPVIEASPTEMSTVNTILKRSVQIANQLELDHIVLVFDQAIYAKAQQIRWKDDDFTQRIVIRLGEFHTCMSYLSILGKRFGDAGLQDILIESEVVAPGSINGVISGHHYNRSIRAHKLLYESLQRIRLLTFLDSLPPEERYECLDVINEIKCAFPDRTMDVLCANEKFDKMCSKYEDFVKRSSAENPTFAFWSSYIDMVQILLLFVRATRESDWQLHLSTVRLMMPWFFAYDRVNYARYLPSYWLEMVNLPLTHPSCHSELSVKGQSTVQRQSVHGFASIACDQAIEQTCNRDSKTKGGWIGLTQNRAAVYRWILSQHERAAIARQCEAMAGKSPDIRKRKDLDSTRILADEKAVTRIISTLDSMLNPFDTHQDGIVCLSSGTVAAEEIMRDLLAAPEKGEKAVKEFMDQRLFSPSVDIFAPIKTQKLKTFSDQAKTKKKSAAGKEVILRADKKLFSRLLVIGQSRKIDLREILSYSLGTVSYPLASADGSLAKTNKSALMDLLETKGGDCLVDEVPTDGAILFDGMAVIQAIRSIPSTFGELADTILQYIVKLALKHNCTRIDFVIDQYPKMSIKNLERSRRAGGGTQLVKIYGRDQKTPTQWKKFLSDGTNKEALAEFLYVVWREADLTTVGKDLSLYIAHGDLCHCVTVMEGLQTLSAVDDLTCDHEECDTRVFLHAQHAAQEHQTVVIKSPDTDVAVIALSLQPDLPCRLYFFTGVGNKTRLIDLAKVSSALGTSVCLALIGIHTFSGCDSTSAFYGKGKRKAFSVACEKEEYLTAFTNLGSSFNLDQSTFELLCTYVCHLYGQSSAENVNDARYKAFCMASSALPELSMPPTSDALYQHCKRANYQAAIMRHSLKGIMCAPSPVGNGWHLEDGELTVTWMTRNPAPESVLQAVHCSCKHSKCETGRCSCMSARLSCTDLCRCQNCANVSQEKEERPTWDDASDSDRDDTDE